MRYLSGLTKEWTDLEPHEVDEEDSAEEPDPNAELPDYDARVRDIQKSLTDILTAENLIVLTGLGTSLCIKSADGKRLAPTMSDLWERIRDADDDRFDQVIQTISFDSSDENIESLLSHCLLYNRLNDDDDVTKFISDAEEQIASACRFVTDEVSLEAHEAFLRRVARRSSRLPRMQLYTTNYDLCFEEAASRTRFVVIDGFTHTSPQEFDSSCFSYDIVRREPGGTKSPIYIPNVFHLYKLHGSIDWEQTGSIVRRVSDTSSPLLIYPRESKFEISYNHPFFEHISRFQTALRQPNTALIVVGFGFNDMHIAQPIMTALRANVHFRLFVVMPNLVDLADEDNGDKNEHLVQISRLALAGDQRIGLLAATFEDLVGLLPQLVGPTEEEQHIDRLRKAEATNG
jgi:hypothetical protein